MNALRHAVDAGAVSMRLEAFWQRVADARPRLAIVIAARHWTRGTTVLMHHTQKSGLPSASNVVVAGS